MGDLRVIFTHSPNGNFLEVVPEPLGPSLFGLGLIGLAALRRRASAG
jgi:hypothetical protein